MLRYRGSVGKIGVGVLRNTFPLVGTEYSNRSRDTGWGTEKSNGEREGVMAE
jgi:hypothetical protein